VVSYRYDLPFFTGASGWKKVALDDWAISGITVIQSGTPFSVTDSAAGTAFLGPGYTPTLTGNLADGGAVSKGYTGGGIGNKLAVGYLNPANFGPAPQISAADGGDGVVTNFGNLGRNTFRGRTSRTGTFPAENVPVDGAIQSPVYHGLLQHLNHANFANPAINDVETIAPCTVGTPVATPTVSAARLGRYSRRWGRRG